MTASVAQRWLRVYRPRPRAQVRVVCLPHAGGNATAFRPFVAELDREIELVSVQYPGRLDRAAERWPETARQAAAELAGALAGLRDLPLALFGHSLGAVLGYEIARLMTEAGQGPDLLMVSGHPAPHRTRPSEHHLLSDELLWAEIERLDGTPQELLDHEELRAYVLPSLRQDYRLGEQYVPEPWTAPTLDSPIVCLAARDDTEVSPDEAQSWQDVTTGGFTLEVHDGGHFALFDDPAATVGIMHRGLNPLHTEIAR